MFNENGNIKPWEDIKIELYLKDTQKKYWLQIIDALPKSCKDAILKDKKRINLELIKIIQTDRQIDR